MPAYVVPTLESDGIRLRPFTYDDAHVAITAGHDPDTHWVRFDSGEDASAAALRYIGIQIERAEHGSAYCFAIALAVTDEAIGQFSVRDIHHGRATLGYWVAAAHRGRGIARRALTLASDWALALPGVVRVELEIEPWNHASRRVAEAAGFEREGLLRKYLHITATGDNVDVFIYSRVR